MARAYYNEIDKHAAAWLRELIKQNLIAPGDVDERSIKDVRPDDLRGYTQVHFFAGIGGWSLALRLAGWADDKPVWTGSCPCQPYSAAGKRKGNADERNLWPAMFELIRACRPAVVFGEQVASSDVVGLSRKHKSLFEVRDREIVHGICRELQGQSPWVVPGMWERGRAPAQTCEPSEDVGALQGVAGYESGIRISERCAVQSEEAGFTLQSRPGEHSTANRCGSMRIVGHSVRPHNASGMERAVAGPDRFDAGLYGGECEGGSLLPECDVEHMGSGEDFSDCVGDHDEAEECLRTLISELIRQSEKINRSGWLDGISADLEREDYAVGSAVLGAHSVGAPHRRQRLYWVVRIDGSTPGNTGHPDQRGAVAGTVRDTDQPGLERRIERVRSARELPSRTPGAWSDYRVVPCADGKARRIESSIEPLAHGVPARMVRLRGYGNAIVHQCAAAFIQAFTQTQEERGAQ